MFFVVLSGLFLGLLSPLPQVSFLENLAIFLFAYMTFVTALETDYKSFIQVLARPWITAWILLLIHVIMPLLAWLIGMLFYPGNALVRLGFLIGASIPIGVTSILWSSIAKGDIPLALVTVTVDTLLSPFILPVIIYLMAGTAIQISYGHMLGELLLMVTIPSFLGMAVNTATRGAITKFAKSFGGLTSKLAIFGVIFISGSAVAAEITWDFSLLKLLLTILLISISGYGLGFVGAYPTRNRNRQITATMVYTVGMRNISFGSVLAVTNFPPIVAITVTLAMLYQQPLAALIAALFHRYDRLHTKLHQP